MASIARLGLSGASRLQLAGRYLRPQAQVIIPYRACGWVRDWKPGPYPKTKEERLAAARKYNLIPEDYEPNPEFSGFGDYPKLPEVGEDAKDKYDDYDYYYYKRNYGETLHYDYDIHTAERMNPNTKLRYSILFMVSCSLGFLSIFIVLNYIDRKLDLRSAPKMKEKQFWKPGVVHYTFEPAD